MLLSGYFLKNRDMYMYVLRAVRCSPVPYYANSFNGNTHNAEQYSSQLFGGGGEKLTHGDGCSSHSNRTQAHVPFQRTKHTH